VVDEVRVAESKLGGRDALSKAVARGLAKLMAYKDEYEVARLYSDGEFERRLRDTFEGEVKLNYHLAPPLLARRDDKGHLVKRAYGPWMRHAFRWLARLKFLRGGALDPFGYTQERRTERALIGRYVESLRTVLPRLSAETLPLVLELASLPEHIRGFGHVKEAHLIKVQARWDALLAQLTGTARGDGTRRAA